MATVQNHTEKTPRSLRTAKPNVKTPARSINRTLFWEFGQDAQSQYCKGPTDRPVESTLPGRCPKNILHIPPALTKASDCIARKIPSKSF